MKPDPELRSTTAHHKQASAVSAATNDLADRQVFGLSPEAWEDLQDILDGPEVRCDAHKVDNFDCRDKTLNNWLGDRARRNQREGSSRTWVVANGPQVVAFYASSTAVIARTEAIKRAARDQPNPLPSMLLGRLAVDIDHQGQGLAAALLKHFVLKALEVAEIAGLRLVLVHAKNGHAAGFYSHYGFEPCPIDELTLMLPIRDIRG